MVKKREKRNNQSQCKLCWAKFDDYGKLKDHHKEKHLDYYMKVRQFVDDTSHEGKVNE